MFGVKKFALIVTGAERTAYAPELVQEKAKVETMYKHAKELIERVRSNCQPNRSHRGDSSLHPTDDESNERLRLATSIRDLAESASIQDAALNAYLRSLADAEEQVNKAQEKYFKQVSAFCVKELRKFTEGTYVNMKQCLSDLDKKRDAYDFARHKLKKCSAEEMEAKREVAKAAQRDFEEQTSSLFELCQKIPEHEMALAKALYVNARAETDYAKEVHKVLKDVPSPPFAATKSSSSSVIDVIFRQDDVF